MSSEAFKKFEVDKINAYKRSLKRKQDKIEYQSEEDEGAIAYHCELQSIIDVIDRFGSIYEIKLSAMNVGESCNL